MTLATLIGLAKTGPKFEGRVGAFGGVSQVKVVQVDAAIEETHARTAELTEHAIEGGSRLISDHRRRHQLELTMDGVLSDAAIALTSIALGGAPVPAIDRWSALKEIEASDVPFTIVTGLERYEHLLFTSLVTRRNAGNSGAIHFSATLRQVEFVNATLVAVEIPETLPGGKAEVSQGKKATKAVTTPAAVNQSAAAAGFDYVSDLLGRAAAGAGF